MEGERPSGRAGVWGRFEVELEAASPVADPLRDVAPRVAFASPSGRRHSVEAFWDGGATWRARFSPDEPGRWTWESECEPATPGLAGAAGEFECECEAGARGTNPLCRHGELRVAPDGTHLEHADGTPFFWLGCTAWNGMLLSDEAGWREYLDDRAAKGFTVTQVVMTQWRAGSADREGRAAFAGRERIAIVPEFFRRLDAKFDEANARGIVVAAIMLWAIEDPTERSPGWALPEGECAILARYMAARYGAHHVVWTLGGDGRYEGEAAEKWRRIGREVFVEKGTRPRRRLATMHPCGLSAPVEEFRGEPWFDFFGYQSGHGDAEKDLRWLLEGPPATAWRKGRALPFVNLEPNYEGHLAYQSRRPFDEVMVRRAAYWSLLVAPTAGVTYGAHGIWPWQEEAGIPLDHPHAGEAPSWREAVKLPGSESMRIMRSLFDTLEWWRLRPAPELLASQPGEADPNRFVAAAATDDRAQAAVYLPAGRGGEGAVREVDLRTEALPEGARAEWFDPATGDRVAAGEILRPGPWRVANPFAADAALVISSRAEGGAR